MRRRCGWQSCLEETGTPTSSATFIQPRGINQTILAFQNVPFRFRDWDEWDVYIAFYKSTVDIKMDPIDLLMWSIFFGYEWFIESLFASMWVQNLKRSTDASKKVQRVVFHSPLFSWWFDSIKGSRNTPWNTPAVEYDPLIPEKKVEEIWSQRILKEGVHGKLLVFMECIC